jgi:hypothetical protein
VFDHFGFEPPSSFNFNADYLALLNSGQSLGASHAAEHVENPHASPTARWGRDSHWPFDESTLIDGSQEIATASAAGDDSIYVVDHRITSDPVPPAGNPDGNQEETFSGIPADGGGGGGYPDPKDTPCVQSTFSTTGASLTEANRAALAASTVIASMNDETYEYSSIIFASNGYIGFTNPYTDHDTMAVNWVGGLASVPDGAIILGIVHNHPDDPAMKSTIPSGSGSQDGDDWRRYDELVNFNNDSNPVNLPRGITVDQSMLLYIYSNEDHMTHVYDKTDKNQEHASCSLQ